MFTHFVSFTSYSSNSSQAPLAVFPARMSVDYVLFGADTTRRINLRFYGETVVLYLLSFALSIVFPSIATVFNFTVRRFHTHSLAIMTLVPCAHMVARRGQWGRP